MPAEPAEPKAKADTGVFDADPALPSFHNLESGKSFCSQRRGNGGKKDSVASKLNQVEVGKGGSAGCSRKGGIRTEQQEKNVSAAAAVGEKGGSSRTEQQEK